MHAGGGQDLHGKDHGSGNAAQQAPGYPVRAFSNIEAELKRLKTGASFRAASCCAWRGCSAPLKQPVPFAKPAKDENAKLIPEMARALTYDGVAFKADIGLYLVGG